MRFQVSYKVWVDVDFFQIQIQIKEAKQSLLIDCP